MNNKNKCRWIFLWGVARFHPVFFLYVVQGWQAIWSTCYVFFAVRCWNSWDGSTMTSLGAWTWCTARFDIPCSSPPVTWHPNISTGRYCWIVLSPWYSHYCSSWWKLTYSRMVHVSIMKSSDLVKAHDSIWMTCECGLAKLLRNDRNISLDWNSDWHP